MTQMMKSERVKIAPEIKKQIIDYAVAEGLQEPDFGMKRCDNGEFHLVVTCDAACCEEHRAAEALYMRVNNDGNFDIMTLQGAQMCVDMLAASFHSVH
jgi:hypothetical protein